MKKLLIIGIMALLFHTGRYYPIFTGNTGIQMLMCEYGSQVAGPLVWVQFENYCRGTINY